MPRSIFVVAICFALAGWCRAEEASQVDAAQVLRGLREFYAKTARVDGSFQPGIDPDYLGMSDAAFSDLAAVTYACTLHKTFGWKLPHKERTIEFLLSRQLPSGEFVNVAGTVDPKSPQGRTYNTTQALVALRTFDVKPRFDPLPVFEDILKQDYKTLPAYSTSFFPLAYLCAGKPIPEQADRSIRALMTPDDEGYLNNHIAATFHASHYYALVGEPTPKSHLLVGRAVRDQNADGSWFLNLPSRDRHATFDAVFTLKHEGRDRADCRAAIERAAKWALSCRNADGGFGHFPGSTSDADAIYFQIGTLVMAGVLQPSDPAPSDPHLLSWGHMMPLRKAAVDDPVRIAVPGWVGGVALDRAGTTVAAGSSDGRVRLWDARSGKQNAEWSGHSNAVVGVAFSPDDSRLATASFDHTAKLWNVRSREVRQTLSGHRGAVLAVAFSPDGSLLATTSIDQTIRLWDSATGALRRTLTGHKSWVNSVAFCPDGKQLVSGSSDGTVKVWSTSGELIKTLPATKAEVRSVAVSPDGKYLAAGVRFGAVIVWTTNDWELKQSWEHHADDVWSVAFAADSRQLLMAAGEWNRPTTLTLRDVVTGETTRTIKHPGEVLSLAFSADGKTTAAGGGDKTVSVWRAAK